MKNSNKIIKSLKKIVGKENVLTTVEDLAVYSYDAAFEGDFPFIVVLPQTTEQVSEIVKIAAVEKIPIIPRGMGSGMAAASVPVDGGIVLSLTKMNQLLEVDKENSMAVVQCGMVTADFQAAVEKEGLFYPPDPSSIKHSTIGGNIACNAGGPRCLKYGVTGNYVMGLTVVLADGTIAKTGGKMIKNVAGYDLNSLLTGSEGTLGIITEATLKLIALPKFLVTARVEFDSIKNASETVTAILNSGIIPATIELMDQTAISCIEEAFHLGLPVDAAAILIIECDGNSIEQVKNEMKQASQTCKQQNAGNILIAEEKEDRENLWKARRSVSPSLIRKAPNKIGEDISVPRSAIPDTIDEIKKMGQNYGLEVVIFGHAGDGNLHVNILYDEKIEGQKLKVEQLIKEVFKIALNNGGTISGEHGIGLLKKPYLEDALGEKSVEIQKRIKAVFDPNCIMNPGKVFTN